MSGKGLPSVVQKFRFYLGVQRAVRRQAEFIVLACIDLVTRPGFSGIHLSGSAEQLHAADVLNILGILPDLVTVEARAERWDRDDNPWKLLFTDADTISTNYAWNEAYQQAKKNNNNLEGTYMWSLFMGGIVKVAMDHVAIDSARPVQYYMKQLYGGATYLESKLCPGKKAAGIANGAMMGSGFGMLGGMGASHFVADSGSFGGGRLLVAGLAVGAVVGAVQGSHTSTKC